MTEERMNVTFTGRYLGTASDWDGDNTFIWYYDFQSATNIELPPGDSLNIDWEEGIIILEKYETDVRQEVFSQDLIVFLSTIPRTMP